MMLTETSGLPEPQGPALGPGVELNGRYVLENRLEHGRIGVVYKALDKHRSDAWGVAQHVALLVVPPHAVRGPLLDPFKQAFAAVRLLRHPRIAAVYDFEAAGETFFLTMEYVDGESLRSVIDMLAPETLSRDEAWSVVAAVGEALLHAHEADVVHGDVRAENVVVAARGQVKMLFSPACIAASAPFVADEREDVYGLAELAYELLAGQKPPADALLRSPRRIHASRIEGLSRGQWKALQAGLAGREERTRTVAQLLAGLDVARSGRKTRKVRREPRETALAIRDSGRMPILGPADADDEPVQRYVRPADGYERTADRDDRPADRDDRVAYHDDRPVADDNRPLARDDRPGPDDRPAQRDERPMRRAERPVDRDDRPVERDDRLVDRDDYPVDRDDRYWDRDDRHAGGGHRSADRDDRPADGDHRLRPADRYVHPADDYDWSEDGYDGPAQGYDQDVDRNGRAHADSRPRPSSTRTSPFPARHPEPSSTATANWSPAAPSAPSPHPSMVWPRPGGAGLRSGGFTPAATGVPPPLPMSEFRKPRPTRPRLKRRVGASVVIMAIVMTVALALLRYGPMEIGRRTGATSVVALDAVRQHVLEPASRGVKGFVRAARERAAAGAPGGAGATNGGPAAENGATDGGPAASGAADGAAPAFGAAAASAPESDREGNAPATAPQRETAANTPERETAANTPQRETAANGPERESDEAPAVRVPESAETAPARAPTEGARIATERASASGERPGENPIGTERAALPESARQAANRAEANASGPAANVAAPAPSAAPSAPSAGGAAVYFTAREIIASEGQTVVPVEIARSRAGSEISVLWWTADETATAGNDYADLGGVIETFEPGQTSRTVFIPITNDSLPEGRETFVVRLALQSPDAQPRNEPQSVRVTIVDDDF